MKVLATDLDNTFLHRDLSYSSEAFGRLLTKWLAQGNRFVVATGRELRWVEAKFAPFMSDIDVVASNGVVLKLRQETATMQALPAASLMMLQKLIVDQIGKPAQGLRAYTKDKLYLVNGMGNIQTKERDFTRSLYDEVYEIDQLQEISDPILTVTGNWAAGESDQAAEAINDAGIGLYATTSGYGAVDILPAGVNKANTLSLLLTKLGLSSDQLIAFGDGMNDLEMLRLAGHPFVMPNGDQRLLNEGFTVVPKDNNHDGVLEVWQALMQVAD